jgi:hypothetical protein
MYHCHLSKSGKETIFFYLIALIRVYYHVHIVFVSLNDHEFLDSVIVYNYDRGFMKFKCVIKKYVSVVVHS